MGDTISIEPAGARDLAMHREKYEQFQRALEAEGHNVTIDVVEYRDVHVVTDIIIHVGEWGATAKGLAELIKLLRRFLRGLHRAPTGEPRRAVIYGPNGEILSTVELPDDADH